MGTIITGIDIKLIWFTFRANSRQKSQKPPWPFGLSFFTHHAPL